VNAADAHRSTAASVKSGPQGIEVALLGAGAIGSRVAAALPTEFSSTIVDNQLVSPENLATSCFTPDDCHQPKAHVATARRRERGAVSRAMHGEVRYAVRPGFVRAQSAVLIALDNPSGIRDVVDMLWDAAIAHVPLIIMTCGNATTGGGHQVRAFLPARDRACPCCVWGHVERLADRHGRGASCAVTSAPRASAEAAEGAAVSGLRLLRRWLDGDDSIAGVRTQCDAAGRPEYAIRMPAHPVRGCSVPHHAQLETGIDLDGTIDTLTVGAIAERALATAGADAEILVGRREIPMMGMSCKHCGTIAPPPLRLMSAATAAPPCGCPGTLVPLATRSRVGARELASSDAAAVTLRAFGSGPGEELLAVGSAGTVRLRARFEWKELDP
jgi:hypothetical protein